MIQLLFNNKSEIHFIKKFTLAAIFVVSVASCSDSSSTGSSPEPEPDREIPQTESFTAEPGEQTTYISSSTADAALVETDEENHTYTFRSDNLSDEGIEFEPEDILLIEGEALRKISSVTESGSELIVETEFATLNEAFRNADVNHSKTIDFTETVTEKIALEYNGMLLKPNASGTGGTWEYEFGDVTIEGVLDTEENKAKIELLVKYDTGDVSGAMRTSTEIENVKTETAFRIEDHETKHFRFHNPGIKGSTEMEFVLAGGDSSEERFAPPMPAIVIPFTIGPIPVVFRMGPLLVYKLELGAEGSASFETSFSYDGDMGFEVDESEFTPILGGGVRKPGAENAEGNAAGFGGTVSGQYGVGLPEITFSMFGETVVPYLRSEFYIGASYTFPTCTHLFSRYEVNAGIDMSLFGLASLNTNSNLVEIYPHDTKSDGCENGKMNDAGFNFISLDDFHSASAEKTPVLQVK